MFTPCNKLNHVLFLIWELPQTNDTSGQPKMNTPKLNSNQSLIFILDIQEKYKHLQTTHWLIMLIFWALFHPFPTFMELFFKARNPGGTDPQPQWPFIAVKVAMDWWNHPSPQHGTRKPLKWSMNRTDKKPWMFFSKNGWIWVLSFSLKFWTCNLPTFSTFFTYTYRWWTRSCTKCKKNNIYI